MGKEERDLAKRAEEQGFEVRRTSKGHYLVTKDGRRVRPSPAHRPTIGPSRTRRLSSREPGSSISNSTEEGPPGGTPADRNTPQGTQEGVVTSMPQAWSIEVELGASNVSDDTVEELHEHLADHSPAVGTAPSGNLSARIFVEAGTARQAADSALKEVTAAAKQAGINHTVVGIELVTEEELDRRLNEPAVPELVGVSEIAAMFGVGRQRAAQVVQREDFPPAVARLKAGPVFIKWQVEAFEKRWDRRGGRPAKPVKLTELDREVLAALNNWHSATSEAIKGWALAAPQPGRLRAAFPADNRSARAAITRLAKARLVSVEKELTHDDEVVVELELTAKGEQAAATQ